VISVEPNELGGERGVTEDVGSVVETPVMENADGGVVALAAAVMFAEPMLCGLAELWIRTWIHCELPPENGPASKVAVYGLLVVPAEPPGIRTAATATTAISANMVPCLFTTLLPAAVDVSVAGHRTRSTQATVSTGPACCPSPPLPKVVETEDSSGGSSRLQVRR
jgi:hypothetical protein